MVLSRAWCLIAFGNIFDPPQFHTKKSYRRSMAG
jgi:hypothetical protein